MSKKAYAYERVTERILDLLEQGTCPWRRPWSRHNIRPQNGTTGHKYTGINFFLLESMAYEMPYFLTFKQVKERKGCVRKGSKGFPIVYWGTWQKDTDQQQQEEEAKKIPFLKLYTVFNASQIEGVEFPALPDLPERPFNPIEQAESIVEGWSDCPAIEHGFKRACYIPSRDLIQLPRPESFSSDEAYYEVKFHEMAHATGSSTRLDRDMTGSFGDSSYGKEELIAEMTSAFLCAECGIDNHVIENQAAYVQGWMKAIKSDARIVVTAASAAQKAANLILGHYQEPAE